MSFSPAGLGFLERVTLVTQLDSTRYDRAVAPLSKRERSIASKYRKYERSREQAKKFYDRADRLLLEIAKSIQPN